MARVRAPAAVAVATGSETAAPAAPAAPTESTEADDRVDDRADANNRVHHHARIDDDGALAGTDTIRTLCGLRLPRPRPDATRMPCCPMCALKMGGPCR